MIYWFSTPRVGYLEKPGDTLLSTVENDLTQAALDLTTGSEAMVWALEQGHITPEQYSAAEEPYDVIWNKIHNLAWDEVNAN